MVTAAALAIAPEESVTTPTMLPVPTVVCARAREARLNISKDEQR